MVRCWCRQMISPVFMRIRAGFEIGTQRWHEVTGNRFLAVLIYEQTDSSRCYGNGLYLWGVAALYGRAELLPWQTCKGCGIVEGPAIDTQGAIMKIAKLLLVMIVLLLINGCATNPYTQFFHFVPQMQGKQKASDHPQLIAAQTEPRIYGSNDFEKDSILLYQEGYRPLGISSFTGPMKDPKLAIEQAKKIEAEIILIKSKYQSTHSGSMSIPVQQPGQMVTTTHTGTVQPTLSPLNSMRYSGQSVTYIPGVTTMHNIPYTVHSFEQAAVYFAKAKPHSFGFAYEDIPPELSSKIKRNRGVLIIAVVKNSPMYSADLVRGDIIVAINDQPTDNIVQMRNIIRSSTSGKSYKFSILRDGTIINKNVIAR